MTQHPGRIAQFLLDIFPSILWRWQEPAWEHVVPLGSISLSYVSFIQMCGLVTRVTYFIFNKMDDLSFVTPSIKNKISKIHLLLLSVFQESIFPYIPKVLSVICNHSLCGYFSLKDSQCLSLDCFCKVTCSNNQLF